MWLEKFVLSEFVSYRMPAKALNTRHIQPHLTRSEYLLSFCCVGQHKNEEEKEEAEEWFGMEIQTAYPKVDQWHFPKFGNAQHTHEGGDLRYFMLA